MIKILYKVRTAYFKVSLISHIHPFKEMSSAASDSSGSDSDVPISSLSREKRKKKAVIDEDEEAEFEFDEEENGGSEDDGDYNEDSQDEEEKGGDDNDDNYDGGDDSEDSDAPLSSLKSPPRKRKSSTTKTAARGTKTKNLKTSKKAKTTPSKTKKKTTSTKKSSPTKKTIKKKSTKTSGSSSSDGNYQSASAALYADSKKGKLISELLCRWWYAITWPEPSCLPEEMPPNCDKLDGFPGVYVTTSGDDVGKIIDYRNHETCPNFQNYAKKSSAELVELLLKAIVKQREVLIQNEGKGTDVEKDLNTLEKWAKKLNAKTADKEAEKVLKAAGLKLK